MNYRVSPHLALAVGILSVSFAAIFIRLADAPAAVIAFYRMSIATFVLAVTIGRRSWDHFRIIGPGDLLLLIFGGAFLAAHFLLWISSFTFTSVASSVFFVTTQPIFVAIAAAVLLGEKPNRLVVLGVLLACLGSVIIGIGDLSLGTTHLKGNLLALGGSVMAAGYLLVGRRVRQRIDLGPYVLAVYGFCSLFLAVFVLLRRLPFTDYSPSTWQSFLLLALIPTLIGHSSFNWALRYLPAPTVSTAILGEPVGATLLAYLLLKESPALHTIVGGSLILGGIYVATRPAAKLPS